MSRNYQRKSERSKFTETQLQSALDDIKTGLSQLESAPKYGIFRTTLLRYAAQGGEIKKSALGRKAVLTAEEESKLAQYIIDCSKKIHGLGLQITRELAYSYAINLQKETIPESWHAEKMAGKD